MDASEHQAVEGHAAPTTSAGARGVEGDITEEATMSGGLNPPVQGEGKHDNDTRRRITYALLLLLAVVVCTSLALVGSHQVSSADMNELLDRLFTPLVALAGTALGFYFGERRRDR